MTTEIFCNDSCQRCFGRILHDTDRCSGLRTLHKAEFTEQAEPLLYFFIERYREAFDAEIDAFVDAIENGTPPEVGFEDGRLALVLAEAAMKSLAEGRMVRTSEVD